MSGDRVRLAGLAGIAAGVLIVVAVSLVELVHTNFYFLLMLAMLLILAALVGFQSRQREQAGLLGRIGYVLALFGVGVLAVMIGIFGSLEVFFDVDLEESRGIGLRIAEGLLIISFIALLAGIVVYGIATIRANVLPRVAAILFLIGLPVALAIDMATGAFDDETLTSYGLFIGFPVFALGLAWLGYGLWAETRPGVGVESEGVEPAVPGGE